MKSRFTLTHFMVGAVIVMALAAATGYAPDAAAGGLAMLPFIGNTAPSADVLTQIKGLVEQQGTTFEEFKKANDALMAAKAEGKAVGDLTEKVTKLNDALTDIGKQMKAIEAKSNRPELDSKGQPITEEQKAAREAFDLFLRKGVNALSETQRKAMNSSTDTEGGYLVLPEMDKAIDRIAPTISAMYRLADVITIGSNKWEKVVKKSGMAMRRVAEGATGGETTPPQYGKVQIEVFEAEVEPWIYNATLEDSFVNLEADLADEAGIAFAEGAGAEFISGNGVGKARGITGYDIVANSSYEWGKVGYIASGGAGAFAASNPGDKLIDLQHALKAQYRPGAVWLMNDATLGTTRQMKDGSGNFYLWQPDPTGSFGGRLLGHPVEVDDNMAAIAANSYSIAFGNFKRGYAIVNRSGTTLIRDNITAKGTTKFNFRRRFGGGIKHFEAIKLMKFAAS
jgi:HK97 family phage major capsid protein